MENLRNYSMPFPEWQDPDDSLARHFAGGYHTYTDGAYGEPCQVDGTTYHYLHAESCGFGPGQGRSDGSGPNMGCFLHGRGYTGYPFGNIKYFEKSFVRLVDDRPVIIVKACGNFAEGRLIHKDLSTEYQCFARHGYIFGLGYSMSDALNALCDKIYEEYSDFTRKFMFIEHFPNPEEKHPAWEFALWHYALTGSCRTGRDNYMEEHGIKSYAQITARQFLDFAIDAAFSAPDFQEIKELYKI